LKKGAKRRRPPKSDCEREGAKKNEMGPLNGNRKGQWFGKLWLKDSAEKGAEAI